MEQLSSIRRRLRRTSGDRVRLDGKKARASARKTLSSCRTLNLAALSVTARHFLTHAALLPHWLLDGFAFFHAEIYDKAFGQFLVRFNMRVELWGCALVNILHSGVERLP